MARSNLLALIQSLEPGQSLELSPFDCSYNTARVYASRSGCLLRTDRTGTYHVHRPLPGLHGGPRVHRLRSGAYHLPVGAKCLVRVSRPYTLPAVERYLNNEHAAEVHAVTGSWPVYRVTAGPAAMGNGVMLLERLPDDERAAAAQLLRLALHRPEAAINQPGDGGELFD